METSTVSKLPWRISHRYYLAHFPRIYFLMLTTFLLKPVIGAQFSLDKVAIDFAINGALDVILS